MVFCVSEPLSRQDLSGLMDRFWHLEGNRTKYAVISLEHRMEESLRNKPVQDWFEESEHYIGQCGD